MKLAGRMVILFAALFFLWAGAAHAVTINISAPKVELELAPGASYSGEISVENPTANDLSLKLYLEDWQFKGTGTGEKLFSPPGTLPTSAGNWIVFSPSEEVLKPYGRSVVRYTVNVPSEAAGAHYSVLFFEAVLGTVQNEQGANVLVSGRIGTLFYIYVKGTAERRGEVRGVEIVPPSGNSPLTIRTDFHNTGNTDMMLDGSFLVFDAAGSVAARGPIKKIYTNAGEGGMRETEWVGRLAPGAYTAVITYDLGKGRTAVEEKTFAVE